MSRNLAATIVAVSICACDSFGSESSPGSVADGGGGEGGGDAAAATGFCAGRTGFDLCTDFGDAAGATAGWDAFVLPNGEPPRIDGTTFRSPPSSLRIDVPGPMSELGLKKTVGAGTVFHVEAAVQLDQKPQDEFVDILRVQLSTAAGEFFVLADLQPTTLHLAICPQDHQNCQYGDAPHDFHEWRTISVDVDASNVTMKVGDVPVHKGTIATSAVDSMTAVIGPRESKADNALVFRLDDILISHR